VLASINFATKSMNYFQEGNNVLNDVRLAYPMSYCS
jgi:hypothetical protein